ncbi:MAG: sugar phosphate isomerase/epimerase [Acidimicrobiia bacterium]|nr:sugar phosphate isomerase/epimerase [Acidimicrobiia bacterium]
MKLGVNTLLWTAAFGEEHIPLLEWIKSKGFDAVEIARFSWDGFPIAAIRSELDRVGLGVTLCSALTGNLSLVSEEASIRKAAIDFLRQGMESAAEIGSPVFLGPFCSPVGYLPGRRRTKQEWDWAVEGLQALTSTLDRHNITLAVEPLNRFETYFLNTTEDAVKLCREVNHPRVGILFDTFHANIEDKDFADSIRHAAPYLRHVHACENDRGIPGSGHVDWNKVFGALQEAGYDGHVVIESFGFTIREIAAAACIWRDLAPSVDDIAADGLRFLRVHAAAAGGA